MSDLNTVSWVRFVVLKHVLFQAMATGHCAYSAIADSVPSLVHRWRTSRSISSCSAAAQEACTIQIQTRISSQHVEEPNGAEIVGIDPILEVITNEVFRWNAANDDFIFSGKSYVLEKIMVKINFSQDEMQRVANSQAYPRMDGSE